jgi:hypothetical protein
VVAASEAAPETAPASIFVRCYKRRWIDAAAAAADCSPSDEQVRASPTAGIKEILYTQFVVLIVIICLEEES